MNWKKLFENWETFVNVNNLDVEKTERNYIYGKQHTCKAKEEFKDFKIFYDYQFNKSAQFGSSLNLGHQTMIFVPIEINQKVKLLIKRNSFWNRIIKRQPNIFINAHGIETKNSFPMDEIEKLIQFLPDLKISIENFNQRQNLNVPFGQKVILLESKYYPTEFEQLKLSRILLIKLLQEFKNKNLIRASPQH